MTQLTTQLTAGLTTHLTAGLTTGHSAARKVAARLQLALHARPRLDCNRRCTLDRGSTAIGADGKIQSAADILCYNEFAYRFAPFVKWIRLKAYSTDKGVFIVFIYQYTVP